MEPALSAIPSASRRTLRAGTVLSIAIAFAIHPAVVGQTHRDVIYSHAGGEALLLDAHVPSGEGAYPAAVLVHGGGFEAGDKQTYITYIFEPLSAAGFVWFSIDYRLSPKHQFPAAVDDVEAAVGWVRSHAADYKVDPGQIALVGESAGGHLVSFAGARNRVGVNAVVALYGIHDFVSFSAHYNGSSDVTERFLGERDVTAATVSKFVAASPIAHVGPESAPFLMIHGTRDEGVPFEQSIAMCQALRRASKLCDIVEVDAGHGMNTWEPDAALHFYKRRMTDWLTQVLTPESR